ncbi:MAG: FtsX-like permease family protein, partial [Longimicrobiales bacterium]
RAQLAAIGQRMAAAYPDTHEHLRPTIIPYAFTAFDLESPAIRRLLYAVQLGTALLLVLVAANVAVLVYARTATRTGEIAVRTALGASRARVIAQLFVEALVLSAAAAATGMTLAGFALGWIEQQMVLVDDGAQLPFWFDLHVSGGLIAYVAALAILGGTIVGVLPALKATGRNAYGGLQQLAARGSQIRLGRTWTALIVVQVGIAVTVLPTAIYLASELVRYGMGDSGYPAEEFFSAELTLDNRAEPPPSTEADVYRRAFAARFAERVDALTRRLAAEPGVGASFASELPGGEPDRWFEIEGGVATVDRGDPAMREDRVRAAVSSVSAGTFELYDATILAGRGFVDADAAEGSTAVIVDRTFAERMGGGSVLRQRTRSCSSRRAPTRAAPRSSSPRRGAAPRVVPCLEYLRFLEFFAAQRNGWKSVVVRGGILRSKEFARKPLALAHGRHWRQRQGGAGAPDCAGPRALRRRRPPRPRDNYREGRTAGELARRARFK